MLYATLNSAEPHDARAALLAEECALAISYNGLNHAVMMVTPQDLEEFVVGFSLAGGLIERLDDLRDLRLLGVGSARRADVQVSPRAFWTLKQQRRQLSGTSGCGLCGVDALDHALPRLVPLQPTALPPEGHFHELRQRIASAQLMARDSGALHAALYVDGNGKIALCREDIGRHNALDKLIGALTLQRRKPSEGFVVVTSRCSLELIHKAVRAGIGTLVSLSAPTQLTVQWARQHHLNLIHLPHHSAPRVYSPAPALPDQNGCHP